MDSVVGIDPGPCTGMCFLEYQDGELAGRTVLQCEGATAALFLKEYLEIHVTSFPGGKHEGRRVGSVEKFVTGRSAGSRGKAADVTRQLVMELAEVLELYGYAVRIRPAADVKPWSSNKRVAAGLGLTEKDLTDSLRHGWDAARHCIYGGHEAGVISDPLIGKRQA